MELDSVAQKTIRSGIPGLDELLGGKGFPEGSVTFIVGGPGTGKTTFGLQYLCSGAEVGEFGVYICLDENLNSILGHSAALGLNVYRYSNEGKISLVDSSPPSPNAATKVLKFLRSPQTSLSTLLHTISSATRGVGYPLRPARRVVIDSLATLILQFPGDAERRLAIKGIIDTVRPLNCTTLLLSELPHSSSDRAYAFEEYLADGILLMRDLTTPQTSDHCFSVEKMRGIPHDKRLHPYRIARGGLTVFSNEIIDY